MSDHRVTPADLSRELDRTQRQIRDFLRATYGRLDGETRWLLTPEQAAVVRARFRRA